jgi:hypothetical protein
MSEVKVHGPYVLIEKERLDVGGMRLTPGLDEDGKKNNYLLNNLRLHFYILKLMDCRFSKILNSSFLS